MSLDKSLKTAASLERHRNVLKRAERIERMKEEDLWGDEQRPIGLPKVANRKLIVGGKDKKAPKQEEKKETAAAKKEAPAS